MEFPMSFISAGTDYSSLERHIPAPYFRRSFTLEALPVKAELLICGLGFYELWINGQKLTRGCLSPYISNPDDLIYYDRYQLTEALRQGENVIGICLGNGLQNNPGGYTWDFEKARWRGAPALALRLELTAPDGSGTLLESGCDFRTAPSPIRFDDYRVGEIYDARAELEGWNLPGYDDSGWKQAVPAPIPRGEARICQANPIRAWEELAPVSITPSEGGYLYDFGLNQTGVCRLELQGEPGQEITLRHGEHLIDGRLDRLNILCDQKNGENQKAVYICKGGRESYTPSFTYYGFRYVLVQGLKPEQAVPSALTYRVLHTDLPERGGFRCSDETVNKLQELTRRSDLSNFMHFPTDCPQREKNGWTADAALSAEHVLLNLEAEHNYKEWLRAIRKAQSPEGALPGIVPTGGWGFEWGCGPAWDSVLTWIPYYVYLYRGDREILEENAHAILRYLDYLSTRIRPDGLVCWGLGDWCPTGRGADHYKSPLEFTDTMCAMDICRKAAYIFGELGRQSQKEFAEALFRRLYQAARERLIDTNTMTALGSCQTSQAMAIAWELFTPAEKPEAFRRLLELIEDADQHFDMGVLGGRVLFHVLSDFGYTDLALKLITQESFPSYGNWLALGATTLWEDFQTDDVKVASQNHHFWGDISHWFLRHLSGIWYNPRGKGGDLDIRPCFAEKLTFAEGWHTAPEGRISVRWEREGERLRLSVQAPETLSGRISLEAGFVFRDGVSVKPLASGEYEILPLP